MNALRIVGRVALLLFLALVASNVLLPAVARAQFVSQGGAAAADILAALVGADVSAARYTATASTSGAGFACNAARTNCIDLGPGARNTIGTNDAGDILLSDPAFGAATVRIGELTMYGSGWIQANGLFDCNHGCRFRNAYTNEPLRFDEPDGVKIYDSEATGDTTLGTCGTAFGNVEPKTIKDDPTAGGISGHRDRLCRCTSNGATPTPTYAWVNLTTGTVGTSTTCSD